MPSKKKYNARFAPARIKKIMQTDDEVGKVSAAVPVIISKCLEMFLDSLLKNTDELTVQRNAKTLTVQHLKQVILSDTRYDFLKDLVTNIPDLTAEEEDEDKDKQPRKKRRPADKVNGSHDLLNDSNLTSVNPVENPLRLTLLSSTQETSRTDSPKSFSVQNLLKPKDIFPNMPNSKVSNMDDDYDS